MNQPYPILEFDPTQEAIIEPRRLIQPKDLAECCVLCFFQEVISGLVEKKQAHVVDTRRSEMGAHLVYEAEFEGRRLTVLHPGVGAPLAAGLLEEMIALGCRKFIACGGAGVLNREIVVGHVVLPTGAVRDEGTSYHYIPPGRDVQPSPEALDALRSVLEKHGVQYIEGKTWTTDAIYRETPAKVRMRRAEGCLTVEMEAAAFFAVAAFRGVSFAQLLYGGDDVSGEAWDGRDWLSRLSTREALFSLAAEACLAME
jgi:uridine phosphorylase